MGCPKTLVVGCGRISHEDTIASRWGCRVPVASYYTVVHVLAPHPTQPPIPLHTDRDDPVVDLGRVCVVAARRGFIHSKMEIKSAAAKKKKKKKGGGKKKKKKKKKKKS